VRHALAKARYLDEWIPEPQRLQNSREHSSRYHKQNKCYKITPPVHWIGGFDSDNRGHATWVLARAGNFSSTLRSYYQVLINITMAHYILFFIVVRSCH